MSYKNTKRSLRQSNIELLRIVSMLLIISFHYVYKSGYVFDTLNFNSFIVKVFWLFGELGVNLFFLITGYFMVNGKFSFKKLIKICLEIEFYHWVCIIIFSGIGAIDVFDGKRSLFMLFFPITLDNYWFATVYLLLYIFSPYLNILINNLSRKEYKKLLITLLIIFSLIPTIFGFLVNGTEKLLYYNRFIWAIVIYFVGAYIRKFDIKLFKQNSKLLMSSCLSFLLMIGAIVFIFTFREFFEKIGTKEVAYFWTPNNILMLICSVSVFGLFLNLKINNIKIINILASTTLGVYLLHDGVGNSYIWNNIVKSNVHLSSKYSIIYIVVSVIAIFLVGSAIDLLRQCLESVCEVLIDKSGIKKKV